MKRIQRLATAVVLLCSSATAQHALDPARLRPITVPLRHAGSVDVTTGAWTRSSGAVKSGGQTVFNNTCTWNAQMYFAVFDWCEQNFDEGRIPSPSSPGAPAGAEVANHIQSIEVAYCTMAGPLASTGGYDMDVAFFDKLGGDCLGAQPPTPIPGGLPAHPGLSLNGYLPLAGLGLPGSTALGFQACWIVNLAVSNTGLVLLSDGDGHYDGLPAEDKFIWMQRQRSMGNPPISAPFVDGFVIAGDPAVAGYGACSYNIACAIGPAGTPCGTGLDAFDGSWINVDGIGVGSSNLNPGCVNSIAQYGFGTNCYFFGGYPTNPFGSYWLRLTSDGRPGGIAYSCLQSKPTTVANCFASLTVGDPSLASGTWDTTGIPRAAGLAAGTTVGVYIYTHGVGIGQSSFSAAVPFGTLCLSGFQRSSPACSAATALTQPGVCNAVQLTTAVNCNGGALGIQVGEDVNVQCWFRDPGATGDADLSNAAFYTVQ